MRCGSGLAKKRPRRCSDTAFHGLTRRGPPARPNSSLLSSLSSTAPDATNRGGPLGRGEGNPGLGLSGTTPIWHYAQLALRPTGTPPNWHSGRGGNRIDITDVCYRRLCQPGEGLRDSIGSRKQTGDASGLTTPPRSLTIVRCALALQSFNRSLVSGIFHDLPTWRRHRRHVH